MYCPKCGALNDDNAYSCASCGRAMPRDTASQQSAVLPEDIPDHLVESILVTLCCCMPLGIPAIVYAALTRGKLSAGDYTGARETSNQAGTWCIVAVIAGLLGLIISLAVRD